MFTSVFGISIKYETWNKYNSLPFYIVESYDFYTAYIANKRCIVLVPNGELATLPALKKQIQKIKELDNVPIVFKLKTVSFYRRKSLIENKISFVSNKQIFLPFLGTMLTEEKDVEKTKEKFLFSTQQLFLFYLYNNKKQLYVSEAGKILPFSAMTITRAVKQLETTGLFLVSKDGVKKVIRSKYARQELFEKAQKYLSSPVCKKGYIDKSEITENMVFAGETALSEKSMLNPERIATYAISKKLFDTRMLRDELIDLQSQVRLEVWEYDPRMFADDGIADSLSVVLTFSGNSDERIEEAMEELIQKELQE